MLTLNIQWRRLLPATAHSVFRWSRNIFFTFGILALSYVCYVLLNAHRYQAEQARRFEHAVKEAQTVRAESLAIPVHEGAPLGRIEISRVGLTAMVQEGVGEGTLSRAVGHIPSTPLPGQRGNVGLAGHRDSFFRELRHIRLDDEITLATLNGTYRYRVETTSVVAPEETEVLADAGYDRLTLVTCYPFNFVGSAPKRFIISARKISE
jgi:sortase A